MEYTVTNVRLSRETLKRLKLKAADEGKSVAEIVREALTAYLERKEPVLSEEEFRNDPFFQAIGIGKGSEPDSSEAHDRYLYVQPDPPPVTAEPSQRNTEHGITRKRTQHKRKPG